MKPKLRGWLHAATSPLALAAGIVLIALAPTGPAAAAAGPSLALIALAILQSCSNSVVGVPI